MTTNALTRLYDRLAPTERFRLFLDAMDRDDTLEIDRLGRSCPHKTYSMADAAYVDLIEASERIASVFTIMWLDALFRVELAETAHAAFELATLMYEGGFDLGLWVHKRLPSENHPVWQKCNESMSRLERNIQAAEECRRDGIAVLKALHRGFTRFCRTAEVEMENLLVWYRPIVTEVERAMPLLREDIASDPGLEDAIYKKFMSAWPTLGAEPCSVS